MRVRRGEAIEMQLAPEMLAAVELLPGADDDGQLGPYLRAQDGACSARTVLSRKSEQTHPADVMDGCNCALVYNMLRR